jgi:cytochrome P450
MQEYMRTWCEYLHASKFRPVDILPWLARLPKWMPWNQEIEYIRNIQSNLYRGLLDEFRARRKGGERIKECIMAEVIDRAKELGFDSEEKLALVILLELGPTLYSPVLLSRYFAGAILDGGADTNSSALRSIILMLVAFPDIQEKLVKEVDDIIGDRLPNLDDARNLPYVQAFVREVDAN